MNIEAPIIGVERHRLTTDGEGVTTLVAFHGCTLHCKYCLNPQCLDSDRVSRVITPQELVDELMIDNLYFLATGGGITFGGGEPLLRYDFIAECVSQMPKEWKINIETALNVPIHNLQMVFPLVSHFIIDVKDMSPSVYKSYTGSDNQRVIDNLRWLASNYKGKHITIRLPHIPDYNDIENVSCSKAKLLEMGFHDFDEFEYIRRNHS